MKHCFSTMLTSAFCACFLGFLYSAPRGKRATSHLLFRLGIPLQVGFLMLIFLGASQAMSGQILRIEQANKVDSVHFFSGKLGLDFAINNNNSTATDQVLFTTLTSDNNVAYTSAKHMYQGIAKITYNKATGGPLQNRGYLHFRSNFWHKNALSYELFGQAQFDAGRNLDSRFLGGGGIRYTLGKNLVAGTGVMNEWENWQIPGEGEARIAMSLPKSTSYITGRLKLSETAQFSITTYYQVGWDNAIGAARHRGILDTELTVAVNRRLAVEFEFTFSYEDRPIIPLSKSIYTFGTGLSYAIG